MKQLKKSVMTFAAKQIKKNAASSVSGKSFTSYGFYKPKRPNM